MHNCNKSFKDEPLEKTAALRIKWKKQDVREFKKIKRRWRTFIAYRTRLGWANSIRINKKYWITPLEREDLMDDVIQFCENLLREYKRDRKY
jgi:hypothetical protein